MRHDGLVLILLRRELIAGLRAMRRRDLAWIGLGGGALLAYAIADIVLALHAAVIVSTHVVEAVPALCNRGVLMADGGLNRSWDAAQLAEAGRVPGAFEDSVMQALRMHAA